MSWVRQVVLDNWFPIAAIMYYLYIILLCYICIILLFIYYSLSIIIPIAAPGQLPPVVPVDLRGLKVICFFWGLSFYSNYFCITGFPFTTYFQLYRPLQGIAPDEYTRLSACSGFSLGLCLYSSVSNLIRSTHYVYIYIHT